MGVSGPDFPLHFALQIKQALLKTQLGLSFARDSGHQWLMRNNGTHDNTHSCADQCVLSTGDIDSSGRSQHFSCDTQGQGEAGSNQQQIALSMAQTSPVRQVHCHGY